MTRLFASSALCMGLLYAPAALASNTVTVSNVSAEPGDIGVTVEVDLANDDTVVGYQFTLFYPSEILTLTEVTAGAYTSSMSIFGANGTTTGEVEVLGAALSDVEYLMPGGSGSITTLVFSVDSGAADGDYDLFLQDLILSDPDATALSVSPIDGVLTITGSGGEEGGEDEGGEDEGSDDEGGDDEGEDDGSADEGGEESGDDGGEDTAAGEETGGEDTNASGEDGGGDTGSAEDDGGEEASDDGSEDTSSDLTDTGEDSGKDGCGCSASTPSRGAFGLALMVLGLVNLRRRRAV